ncbi:MAG: NFACT RNA binding domain-containing protein [Nanoarchaeota archaeon]
MDITLSLGKGIEENAGDYFEKAKKAKQKLDGVHEIIAITQKKLERIDRVKEAAKSEKQMPKKEWYEKFRWMLTSEGNLVIGGRDATTNDILIKKQMQPGDLVFHADIAGSPFCLLKAEKATAQEKAEVAQFCAINSKAFSLGLSSLDVYAVPPEQIGFSAPAGEYMKKGSFMINGRKENFTVTLDFAAGLLPDGRVMAAPLSAVQKHCTVFIKLKPGDKKKSDVVRKLQKEFGKTSAFAITQEQVMSVLPPGNMSIVK